LLTAKEVLRIDYLLESLLESVGLSDMCLRDPLQSLELDCTDVVLRADSKEVNGIAKSTCSKVKDFDFCLSGEVIQNIRECVR